MGILDPADPRATFCTVLQYVLSLNLRKGRFPPKGMTTRVATKLLRTISQQYYQSAVGISQIPPAVPLAPGFGQYS